LKEGYIYNNCRLCPRVCGIDRTAGKTGFCKESDVLRIGVAVLHCGEEPPLVEGAGSGTIFVSGCNLGCVFCQNYQISQGEQKEAALGRAVSAAEFAEICLTLRDKGAANINIVTGSHAIPAIAQGLTAAKNAGLDIPVLWNSSGYENPEALELLKDHVDIYLPDLKTLDSEIAKKYFRAKDYPQTAAAAILKMIEMVKTRQSKTAKVIVRHLILPGYLDSSYDVLRWFAQNAKDNAMLSLMTQYTPVNATAFAAASAEIPQRYLTAEEYDTVLFWLKKFGIKEGFCQELVTGHDWLPDFRRPNPFSSELSVPVWHFKK
jgi:putative pyruvate formate lyase activating enzyme